MITSQIQHVIVMPANITEEEVSYFQAYSRQLTEGYLEIYRAMALAPHDILDSYFCGKDYVSGKLYGSALCVRLIREDLLTEGYLDFENIFNIFWTTARTDNSVAGILDRLEYRPLHISASGVSESVEISHIAKPIYREWIETVVDGLAKEGGEEIFVKQFKKIRSSVSDFDFSLPFPTIPHNATRPLLAPLLACGCNQIDYEDVVPAKETTQHIEAIVSLVKFIDEKRVEARTDLQFLKNEAIIFAPSILAHLYNFDSATWRPISRLLDKPAREFLKAGIVRNQGYGNFISHHVDHPSVLKESIPLQVLLGERQFELAITTELISILAVNQFCPAIRLPNSINLHRGILNTIAGHICNYRRNHKSTLNKLLVRYKKSLEEDIGDSLLAACFEERKRLIFCCDIPLEWLSNKRIPLMFTHDISRINMTPGNMFAQLSIAAERVSLPYEALTKILVIRSFNNDDPIREFFEIALKVFGEKDGLENIEIVFEDVNSKAELVDALNKNEALIVVFDCHGNHGGDKEHGWLVIGEEEVDVWELAQKARIPPVVILSACSTHPIDGSHASVANGFLRCGALSVIGTYAPVQADHVGSFVARLVFRIAKYVPMLIKQQPTDWRRIVSGLLSMSYVTDVLRPLCYELNVIPKERFHDIHNDANFLINSEVQGWDKKFIERLASESSLDIDEMNDLLVSDFSFVESMLFTHLGRPENLLIGQKS